MGQVPLDQLGKKVQQEVSASIFDTLVKWRGTMAKVEDIPAIMRRAFSALRSGSPGPVVLEMPQDVLMTEVPDGSLVYEPVGPGRRAAADEAEVARWVLGRDCFNATTLAQTFDDHDAAALAPVVEKLIGAGLVQPL